jgi:tetratricopeptide (TPR) repeat protein
MKSKADNSLVPLFKYYANSGQYLIARELATQLKDENHRDVGYLLSCLEMWVQLNEYDEAKETIGLLSAAQYPPDACELCLQLVNFRLKKLYTVDDALRCARVLLAAGKPAETEHVLQHALVLSPENLLAKVQLAKFYLDIGKLSLAISLADVVTKADESNSSAWAIYGNAQRMLGNITAAYDAHIKALSIDEENYESILDVTAIDVSLACNDHGYLQSIKRSNQCLQVYIKKYFKLEDLQISFYKIKHDNEQAKYLLKNRGRVEYSNYINLTDRLL